MFIDKPLGNNNTSGISKLFNYRKSYSEELLEVVKQMTNAVATEDSNLILVGSKVPFFNLQNEKLLYGLIDYEGTVIVPKRSDYGFKTLSFPNGEHRLINFVADAFTDLKNYINLGINTGKISSDNPYGALNIYKSYKNPQTSILGMLTLYAETFKSIVLRDKSFNSKIVDHKVFTKYYINFLKQRIKLNDCVTKSDMILNNFFYNYSSGLMFDIAVDKSDDDTIKQNNYLLTSEFRSFQEGCARFGFAIDENVPWRIIADIESPAMKPYLDKYNIKNTTDLFNKYYRKTYVDEINHLKYFFYNSYNLFLENNIFFNSDLNGLSFEELELILENNNNVFLRDTISEESYFNEYKDDYWLRLYTFFLNEQRRKKLTQQQFENIVRQSSEFYSIDIDFKNERAISNVNRYFRNILDKEDKMAQNLDSLVVPDINF